MMLEVADDQVAFRDTKPCIAPVVADAQVECLKLDKKDETGNRARDFVLDPDRHRSHQQEFQWFRIRHSVV